MTLLNKNQEIIINKKLDELNKSKFRNSFHLKKDLIDYINNKGLKEIDNHIKIFIKEKLHDKEPLNDGKQTPTKNHPVFIAMHACGCCCRSCLEKWHHIKKHKELTKEEENYIEAILLSWIIREYNSFTIERKENK